LLWLRDVYSIVNYIKIIFILLFLQFGCSKKESEKDKLNQKDPIGSYGLPISRATPLDIAEMLQFAENHIGNQVLIKGDIIEVCPMRGCWVQVQDNKTSSTIRIKVTDGEIVFPLSAKGYGILAEGELVKLEFSEKQAKNWKHHLALEKGIELDTAKIMLVDSDLFEYRLNSRAAKIF